MESVKTEVVVHGTKVKEVSYLIIIPAGAWEQPDDGCVRLRFTNATIEIAAINEALDTSKPLKLILEAPLAKPC
jgi:hypothetical protein